MIRVTLLFRGGHTEIVEMSGHDTTLADLVTSLTQVPRPASQIRIFNIICEESNRSVVFGSGSLLGLVTDPPLQLDSEKAEPEHPEIEDGPAIVIDDFLPQDLNQEILSYIASMANFEAARIDGGADQARKARVAECPPKLRDKMMLQVLPLLPAVSAQLGLTYSSIEIFECQITSYADDDFFRPHVDLTNVLSPADSQRLVSFSYYVHASPKSFVGGDLQFYDEDRSATGPARLRVEPINNRIVFFRSDAIHEITKVIQSAKNDILGRLSINGWIRCKV